MKRKLERNPIGWLEQRTWSGRLLTWGWLAAVVSVYSFDLTDPIFFQRSSVPQNVMAWMLVFSIAISTAGSFRRERESGVLELLLVSPIGERTIISGRLRGLWGQFLPAFGLFLLVWLYLTSISVPRIDDAGLILVYAATFCSMPIIGLYFSLRCRAFMTALLAALSMGIVIPAVSGSIIAIWWATFSPARNMFIASYIVFWTPWLFALVQAGIAMLCWKRLLSRLKTRSFPLDRATV